MLEGEEVCDLGGRNTDRFPEVDVPQGLPVAVGPKRADGRRLAAEVALGHHVADLAKVENISQWLS